MISGLDELTAIKSNDRFDSFKAEYNHLTVFAKRAKLQKSRKNLKKQHQNAQTVNEIGSKSPLRPLRSPKTIYFSGDWLLTEWLNTENLGPRVKTSPNKVAAILADYFALFDKQKSTKDRLRSIFTEEGLRQRIDERLKLSIQNKKLVADALERFIKLSKSLTPAVQDADIKPYHLYYDEKEPNGFVLIDSEHLSDDWPRYYDLGNNIAKYFVRNELSYCRALTEQFCERLGIKQKEIFEPIICILIVRSLSMLWSPDFEADIPKFGRTKALGLLKRSTEVKSLTSLLY